MELYSKRQWLNKESSPSTGAVISYHGFGNWCKNGKEEIETFLEIKDCNQSVRLHAARRDTMEEFIKKMECLRNHISKFIEFLTIEYNPTPGRRSDDGI